MKNDPASIKGWVTYDWANSAYATTILAAVLPAYFASVVVPDGGVDLLGGPGRVRTCGRSQLESDR